MSLSVDPGSFRDPSGFIFYRDNTLYRQVQTGYRESYDLLIGSGLYKTLTNSGLLISHEEERADTGLTEGAYRVLRPERVPFISYPYEWCFSQLQDAALATLQIQKEALKLGMTLKDASAYNIQFRDGRPTLIDTLSFERYEEGRPWIAYQQFCRHFLAPLALMSRTDVRLQHLLRIHMDGIPLDLASRLLPRTTWLQPGLMTHIHLHGAAQKRYEGEAVRRSDGQGKVSRTGLLGLIDSLEGTVRGLKWKPAGTTWAEYYTRTNYSDEAMGGKRRLIAELLDTIDPSPTTAWDLGANTGLFSRVASTRGIRTISIDIDPAAVEKNYLECRENKEQKLLPLLGDLTNPSPGLGWALRERRSLTERGPADLLLALALVHHLAIANNVPLDRVARYFRSLGEWLIVEFVPKSDSQVQRLLASREDIFTEYTVPGFETAFQLYFEVVRSVPVPDSERILYLLRGLPPGR